MRVNSWGVIGALGWVIFLSLGTAGAQATQPSATQPAGYTHAQYLQEVLAFNRRTTVEAYRQVGKRDPKWDAAAEAFLEGCAQSFTNALVHDIHRTNDMIEEGEVRELGQKAIKLGCDDPLVLYCWAIRYHDDEQTVRDLLRRAHEGLNQSQYPPLRRMSAADRYYQSIRPPVPAVVGPIRVVVRLQLIEALCQKYQTPGERRFVAYMARDRLERMNVAEVDAILGAVAKRADADPWLQAYLTGLLHIRKAWDARGGGWANTVTPEGWQGFSRHLGLAREQLLQAWKLEPTYPEPAAAMIRVAMGDGDRLKEDSMTWYRRAIAVQIDYFEALDALLWALRPRWGGSHEQMLAIGIECYRSGRYDTMVPYQFLRTLHEISRDTEDERVWRVPEIYAMASDVCRQYAERIPVKSSIAYYVSYHAALAILNEKWAVAKADLDRLGQVIYPEPFEMLRLNQWRLVSKVYARASDQGDEVARAERLLEVGSFDQAAEICQPLLQKLAGQAKAHHYVASLLAQAQWQRDFQAGQWVTLTPDKELAGWYAPGGRWQVDEEQQLVSDRLYPGLQSLVCNQDFGTRFELSAQVEFTEVRQPTSEVGLIIAWAERKDTYGLWLSPVKKQGVIRCQDNKTTGEWMEAKPVNQLLVRHWDGAVWATINDKKIAANYEMEHLRDPQKKLLRPLWIGLAADLRSDPAATARYSKIQVRKLEQRPEE